MTDDDFALIVELVKDGQSKPKFVDPMYWRHAQICAEHELRRLVKRSETKEMPL